jgi:DNA-binding NtrC family response regulator
MKNEELAMNKILVVDDEPVALADLRLAAEGPNRTVLTAKNPAEAERLIGADRFDLIVTDLVMDDDEEAGFSILRAARKRHGACPVIIITAQPSASRTRKALDLGAFDFVDRNARNIDVNRLLQHKIQLALSHRQDSKISDASGQQGI